jgi:hypothetical protein
MVDGPRPVGFDTAAILFVAWCADDRAVVPLAFGFVYVSGHDRGLSLMVTSTSMMPGKWRGTGYVGDRDGVRSLRHVERLRKQTPKLNGVSEIDGFYHLSTDDGMGVIRFPRAVELDNDFHSATCSFSRSSTASVLAFAL